MTATLYLPPGYDKGRDGPLPCILWAYPREFKSREAAGQMRRSPHQFSGGWRAGRGWELGAQLAALHPPSALAPSPPLRRPPPP
jgi:hypothetical protein